MRVYINALNAEQIWSTDEGDITTEQNWHGIRISVRSDTNDDLSKWGSKTEPCCWIEAHGKLRKIERGDGKRWAVIE